GLAAAALADEPERLPARDVEREAVHGAYVPEGPLDEDAPRDGKVLLQAAHADQRRSRGGRCVSRAGAHLSAPVVMSTQQAMWCPGPISSSGGLAWRHCSRANSQRGANGQPRGSSSMLGGEPGMDLRRCPWSRSVRGSAASSDSVYGWRGLAYSSSTSASSTM